jgi:hypothetical protein
MASASFGAGDWRILFPYRSDYPNLSSRVFLYDKKDFKTKYSIPFTNTGFDYSEIDRSTNDQVDSDVITKVKTTLSKADMLSIAQKYWSGYRTKGLTFTL